MKIHVVCTRDPDYENTYEVFAPEGVEVEILTIDPGAGGVDEEWVEGMKEQSADLPEAVRDHIHSVVDEYADNPC